MYFNTVLKDTVYLGSCYKVLTVKAEWYVARNNCDGQGAELSSIRSSQELEFIKGEPRK